MAALGRRERQLTPSFGKRLDGLAGELADYLGRDPENLARGMPHNLPPDDLCVCYNTNTQIFNLARERSAECPQWLVERRRRPRLRDPPRPSLHLIVWEQREKGGPQSVDSHSADMSEQRTGHGFLPHRTLPLEHD